MSSQLLSHRSYLSTCALALALCATTVTEQAFAQEELTEEGPAEEGGVDLDEEEAAPAEPSAEGAEAEAAPSEAGEEAAAEGEEGKKRKKGDVQLLIGARYRAMVIPKALINMFGLDGGRTIFRSGVGGEVGGYFGKTADGFLVMGSVWWLGYGLEPTPFKGKNDPEEAWEVIESKMGAVYLTVDAMWDHKIIDRLSFNVGAGFGLGIVTGKLYRTEAYGNNYNPDLPAEKDWPGLSYCRTPAGSLGPDPTRPTDCPADGNYGQADRWPVYPWINFQLGLRYQPIDQFVGRFDMGIGSSGIWFGFGADYSLGL
jgi:hypothetical protein